MGRILRPQDISEVENMYDAQTTKMGRLKKILSGLSDLDSVVSLHFEISVSITIISFHMSCLLYWFAFQSIVISGLYCHTGF